MTLPAFVVLLAPALNAFVLDAIEVAFVIIPMVMPLMSVPSATWFRC